MATFKSCKSSDGGFVDRRAGSPTISLLVQPGWAAPLSGRRAVSHPVSDVLRWNLSVRLAAAMAVTAIVFCATPPPLMAAERGTAGAPVDMVVTVVEAKNMCFDDTVQVTGVITPREEILVRPDREGLRISQVLVEPGDTVVSGQVLARLNPPEGQQGSGVTVQAPAAGTISSKAAAVGATASASAEPLFRIATSGEMELSAEAPLKTLAKLEPGQSAKVEIVGVSGALKGKVRHISSTVNPTTQLGEVRLFIGRDKRLRVGAFGRATVEIARRCGAAIPFSAVLYGPSGTIVQTVRDGRIETRPVTVGLLAAGQVEIRKGIAEGEMVVPRAGAFVRDGDRVRAIAAPAASR
ncbi:MAG: efflux RND transporter periplasmic adaptor subunit [Xanthobacteraceae bacterium]